MQSSLYASTEYRSFKIHLKSAHSLAAHGVSAASIMHDH